MSRENETPAIPHVAPRPIEPKPAIEDDQALYNRARAEQNPERAIQLFDQVAHRGGSLTEIAAYQAARLTMNAGRANDAIKRFRELIQQHPNGAYAQESSLDVLECRIKLGQLDAAAGDVEAFLQKYPSSERLHELRFLRGEIHRRKNDYDAAAKDYEAALGSRRGADALFFLGFSKMKLGDKESARAHFSRYLERYPSEIHAPEARVLLERLEKK
jgi:TolA-binding protein